MAPKFGLDDGSTSNFDATLVLATMLVSQLHESNTSEPPQAATAMHIQEDHGTGSEPGRERCGTNVSEHPSDHTRIWSDLSGNHFRQYLKKVPRCCASIFFNFFYFVQEVVQEVAVVRKQDRLKGKEI